MRLGNGNYMKKMTTDSLIANPKLNQNFLLEGSTKSTAQKLSTAPSKQKIITELTNESYIM
jgi:hypothetical protein